MKKKEEKKKLVLLDVHAILHRAYHALPDFTSSKGEPTGGLYGLCTMLIGIINDLKPDYIAACYDLPGKTYRHEAYEAYKAGRKKADDALVAQIIRSRDIFVAFGIPIYEKEGFEADDILGTISEMAKALPDIDVIVASGDMDTLQLVEDGRVTVYTLRKGLKDTVLYDEGAVKERFGFGPELLPDYKGLRGDPSDNIIGIAGIGEKTATDLICKFGSIEDIYAKLKKDKSAFKEAGIKERIVSLLEQGEEEAMFSKMLATIRRDAPIDFSLPEKTWKESLDTDKVMDLFADLDFRSLSSRVRELAGKPADASEDDESVRQRSLNEAGGAPDEADLKKISIALWLINSDLTNPTLDDILRFAKTRSFAKAKEQILENIETSGLSRVYKEIELPLIPVVEKMQALGVKIDSGHLKNISAEYHKELSAIEKDIWKQAGTEFNVNSPKQLGEILFDRLGLKIKNHKKTTTGVKSTRESELEKMRDLHPIIGEILKHRELQKLLSTYIDTIPELLGSDGRLHTTFLQAGTTTGRMASQNPNLQNIPIKSERGRSIRKAFIAEKGFCLASFDYSQIELRAAAFLSGDEKLMEVFRTGGDIHTAVASQVFKVPPEKVDYEMRRRAKVINFGIIYGMGVVALRQNLGTSREEAQKFLDEYFETFKGLAEYLDRTKAEAYRLGYTETFFGRRRYFPLLRSPLPYMRAQAERMAINAPIQGVEADIIKIAMSRVEDYIASEKLEEDVRLILQVHDELVYEIKEKKAGEIAPRIKEIMEGVMSLGDTKGVPIIAEAAVGKNWNEMEDLKK